MKIGGAALSMVFLSIGVATAAPGQVRTIQGTLVWPNALGAERFAIVRGDDGVTYYADLSTAQRATSETTAAGGRVSLVGSEGDRPYEIRVLVIGPRDTALSGLQPVPAHAAPPPDEIETLERLEGEIQAVAPKVLTLKTRDGRVHQIDVARLSLIQTLGAGETVAVYGTMGPNQVFVARGFYQSASGGASDLPRPGEVDGAIVAMLGSLRVHLIGDRR